MAALERDENKDILNNLDSIPLREGQTRYLISSSWFNQWKEYVESPQNLERPSNIDNSPLLNDTSSEDSNQIVLRPLLLESRDFIVVSEATWNGLYSIYGGGPVISKRVIAVGENKQPVVEIYPLYIKIFHSKESEPDVILSFSKVSTIKELLSQACLSLNLDDKVEYILWDFLGKRKKIKIDTSNSDSTLDELGLESGQELFLEKKDNSSQLSGVKRSASKSTEPGLCGLQNLGNTCFMNSAIQCLSNTKPLRKYFLQELYLKDINVKNPLGSKGVISQSFAGVLQELWSGNDDVVTPRDLKKKIAQLAPQFSGFQQHDCQELLAYLLDMLHEDLNRVTDKPYVEQKEANGRPDIVVAEEAWQNHLKRNDSVIVDLFQGQYKSKITCPDCGKLSITFDPFMYTSVPIPVADKDSLNINLVQDTINPMKCAVSLSSSNIRVASQLKENIIKNFELSYLILAEISGNRFHRFLEPDTSISSNSDDIYAYSIENPTCASVSKIITPVIQKVIKPALVKYGKRGQEALHNIGIPFFLCLPRKTSPQFLLEQVWKKLHPCVNIKSDGINVEIANQLLVIRIIGKNNIQQVALELEDEVIIQEGSTITVEWDLRAYKSIFSIENAMKFTFHKTFHDKNKPSSLSLNKCLDLFVSEEVLNEQNTWYCPECKAHKCARKKIDLWKLPKILVIHLKRFGFSNRFLWREKLDNFIDFPLKNLDLGEYVKSPNPENTRYDLFAVSNHYGGLGGGHYTAFAKGANDNWFVFDDSKCSQVNENSVKSEAAYVLFYCANEKS